MANKRGFCNIFEQARFIRLIKMLSTREEIIEDIKQQAGNGVLSKLMIVAVKIEFWIRHQVKMHLWKKKQKN